MDDQVAKGRPAGVAPAVPQYFTRRRTVWYIFPLALTAYALTFCTMPTRLVRHLDGLDLFHKADAITKDRCVQPKARFPSENVTLDNLYVFISTTAFRNASVQRLSGAVQVKSESFDDLGDIGTDPRWDVFYDFSAYVERQFPLIHSRLQLEKVNTHGLLYTWQGSDSSLRPTLLMAHQDTVPVPADTIPSWTYPPWSGTYDGTYVWGRGASDCKSQLMAVMETVELLLSVDFKPKRTILLSFGFDEECSTGQGAGKLAPFLHERYGDDGLAVIVDEGSGFAHAWGTVFATPGMGEKGKTDVQVGVSTPGGHSSVPTDHTSIGVLADLITRIEAARYPTRLDKENPYHSQLQCGAAHAADFPPKLKKLLARRLADEERGVTDWEKPDWLALEAAKQGPAVQYLMQTSQAVDIITGGVKVNALPEHARATINHRVNVGESHEEVWHRLARLAGDVAAQYNLTLHAFDGEEGPSSISLRDSGALLRVAPVTPNDAGIEGPYAVLAGTVRAVHGEDIVVTPGISTDNSDTSYYWHLTKHIFRFRPGYDPDHGDGQRNIHSVDEKQSVRTHISSVKWFMLFVRNMDEAKF